MEECQRCNDVDEDRRTLEMACFYDMKELDVPFSLNEKTRTYNLRVCKDCRASWMKAIQDWFHNADPEEEPCGSGIFIREHGAIKEISEEEWYKRNPFCKPVRATQGD